MQRSRFKVIKSNVRNCWEQEAFVFKKTALVSRKPIERPMAQKKSFSFASSWTMDDTLRVFND